MSNKSNIPVATSDWQSYICKINGELASVFVDLALSSIVPLPTKQKLAWLWIRLMKPRDDGLSSDEEYESLSDFEDDLEATLAKSKSCVYAGRITTKGRREFYFYVDNEFDLQREVSDVLGRHSTYSTQLGERLDSSWDHFRFTLLPGSNGLDQIARRKLQN